MCATDESWPLKKATCGLICRNLIYIDGFQSKFADSAPPFRIYNFYFPDTRVLRFTSCVCVLAVLVQMTKYILLKRRKSLPPKCFLFSLACNLCARGCANFSNICRIELVFSQWVWWRAAAFYRNLCESYQKDISVLALRWTRLKGIYIGPLT